MGSCAVDVSVSSSKDKRLRKQLETQNRQVSGSIVSVLNWMLDQERKPNNLFTQPSMAHIPCCLVLDYLGSLLAARMQKRSHSGPTRSCL